MAGSKKLSGAALAAFAGLLVLDVSAANATSTNYRLEERARQQTQEDALSFCTEKFGVSASGQLAERVIDDCSARYITAENGNPSFDTCLSRHDTVYGNDFDQCIQDGLAFKRAMFLPIMGGIFGFAGLATFGLARLSAAGGRKAENDFKIGGPF